MASPDLPHGAPTAHDLPEGYADPTGKPIRVLRWLIAGPAVKLSCGGDLLPVEWWDDGSKTLHARDGGLWWSPIRSNALRAWGASCDFEVGGLIGNEKVLRRRIAIKVDAAWAVKCRRDAGEAGRHPDFRAPPAPALSPEREAWAARRLEIALELTDLARAIFRRDSDITTETRWDDLARRVLISEPWMLRAATLGVIPPPPVVMGEPILPVSRRPKDDAQRMVDAAAAAAAWCDDAEPVGKERAAV